MRTAIRRSLCLAFFLAVGINSHSWGQGFGGIRGQVVDSDFGQPIARSSVILLDTPFGAMTDDQGNFTISGVPPGAYTISVRSGGYLPKLVPGISISSGTFNDVRVETIAEVEEMEELVVPGELEKTSEVGLLAERQGATAVLDTIGADLISRLGAATAGQALKSMVGTSVVDGKYVVIRGLSDRYVNTLLNGGRLPTSDPDKRAVNVDLFPGSVLQSINTSKTFTPDQAGDFTGGSVDIRTKQFPEKPSFGVSVGVEYNSQATFNSAFPTYAGGGTGPFGMNASRREIPESVINNPNLKTPPPIAGVTPGASASNPSALTIANPADLELAENINSAMQQMNPVSGFTRKAVGPNYSVNLQGGDSVEIGPDQTFGTFGAFSYRHKYTYYPAATRANYEVTKSGGAFSLTDQFIAADDKGSEEVLWGTLLGMGYQPQKNQKVSMNLLFNEQATDTTDFQQADTFENKVSPNEVIQYTSLQYSERQLAYLQLTGEHEVSALRNLQIDWVGSLGRAKLNEPDQRLFQSRYDTETDVYSQLATDDPSFTGSLSPLQRYSRDLTENSYNAIVNFSVPFFEEKENPSKFKTGFYIDNSQRSYQQSLFDYAYGAAGDPPQYKTFGDPGDPTNGQTWADVFLNQNRSGLVNPAGALGNDQPLSWSVFNNSGTANFYNASQQVIASYAMSSLRLFPQLTITGGARFENTNLKSEGAPSAIFPNPNSDIQQLDLLPAAAATFQIMPEVNLRLAWSQTLARPSFKELGAVVTQDFSDAQIFIGNPDLKLSSINNYDFRLEYFPRAGEVLAVSLFYKNIDRPIEQTIAQLGSTQFFQYINNPNGTLWGAEFESRKRLDQVASFLKNFSANFNFTYIQSEVALTQEQITAKKGIGLGEVTRPMQGQPNYIINAGLSYDDQARGFYAGLFYNVTGPLLYAAGLDLPDLYEQPAPSLDFNLTQSFAEQWSITFRGKNLLNPIFRQTMTYAGQEYTYLSYTKGFDLSTSINYSF
jgi:TonB-dependent receptor